MRERLAFCREESPHEVCTGATCSGVAARVRLIWTSSTRSSDARHALPGDLALICRMRLAHNEAENSSRVR